MIGRAVWGYAVLLAIFAGCSSGANGLSREQSDTSDIDMFDASGVDATPGLDVLDSSEPEGELDSGERAPEPAALDVVEADAEDTGVDGDIGAGGFPSHELLVRIASPNGGEHAQSAGAVVTVAGLLFGEVDTFTFETSTGQNGVIEPGEFWQTEPLNLAPGDNVVRVRATRGEELAEDSLTVTFNPAFRFDSAPSLSPDVMWLDSSAGVLFSIPASLYPNMDGESMTLHQVDESGTVIATLGTMHDDGDTWVSGDEIEGDGRFSLRANVSCASPGEKRYRVAVQARHEQTWFTALSPIRTLHCLAPVDRTQCLGDVAILLAAEQEFKSGKSVEDVLTLLEANANVLDVGRSSGEGQGLWVRFSDGLLGTVSLDNSAYRGGSEGASGAHERQWLTGPPPSVASRDALVLAPFASDFGELDESAHLESELSASQCPGFELVGDQVYRDGAATLARFRSIRQAGVTFIGTHGDALFGSLDAGIKSAHYGWRHLGSQEALWTGESDQCDGFFDATIGCTITPESPSGDCPDDAECVVYQSNGLSTSLGRCIDRRQADLRLGRVVLSNLGYAVLPSFFDAYTDGGMPSSFVSLAACKTLFNGSLASTLYARGARAITGFSGMVTSAFASEVVTEFASALFAGATLGEAFEPKTSPDTEDAHWRLVGLKALDVMLDELLNPSFEGGTTVGWVARGDGRVITQLGQTMPVQGKFMGLVSTGLGFTVETGSLEQTFCIPPDKTHLRIHWKFYSEEFKEYCGSAFQDDFEVSLETASGASSTLIKLRIDDLCFYSEELCGKCTEPLSCDFDCIGTDACTYNGDTGECEGSYNCECGRFFMGLIASDVSFDKDDVFSTTWQTTERDISALAGGEPVTLRISTSDKGDSIFDTAVLVDAIELF